MLRLFPLHRFHPYLLVKLNLVIPPNVPPLTMQRFKPPLDPFKRSKCPFKLMFPLRAPLFVILSKSGMTSFVGCLLPRLNIFSTIRLVLRSGKISISLMVRLPNLLPHLPSGCFLFLPLLFSTLVLTLRITLCSSMG